MAPLNVLFLTQMDVISLAPLRGRARLLPNLLLAWLLAGVWGGLAAEARRCTFLAYP